MRDLPSLALAHPSLYEACLDARSISTPSSMVFDPVPGGAAPLFLPSACLRLLPQLAHVAVVAPPDEIYSSDEGISGFCHAAAARNAAVAMSALVIQPGCRIPMSLALSVRRLTSGYLGYRPCKFNGHVVPRARFVCHLPDWRPFAAQNPALFDSSGRPFPSDAMIDLSAVDYSRSFLSVAQATPLMIAVLQNEAPEAVAALAALWGRCVFGSRSALMMAAEAGNARLVAVLAQREAGIVASRAQKFSALAHCAAAGHADCVALLITREAGLTNNNRQTALMVAAECHQPQSVALLIPSEAGMANSVGATALLFAAETSGVPRAQRRASMTCVALLLPAEGARCKVDTNMWPSTLRRKLARAQRRLKARHVQTEASDRLVLL
jgi:hypothetical protein